ncbi:hypothetical protein OO007_09950 [Cocleimonas sp. KMM 6892]|uniref:hypothetical protein n=1 Tax=unclassified Cocleimonas TaxID=2639732 RepID=UPI002DBCB6B9|nr:MULTISPECIES: hypothetical protein [unclassified Cocleimonas]MEB8432547.1 hypothetical protein [Cocleimonas sp. KMM 6892]MEC4715406.1 hypothetical protein [Cocleimonas sp. KMM 6895]MEC4744975.1 hypothetical protein [Cocleimonas sp. KMM 6896]
MKDITNNIPSDNLRWCLKQIENGPWNLIQLRGEQLSDTEFNQGDIDLLTSNESVELLLNAVYKWIRERKCHARVMSRKNRKVQLILYSTDGEDCVIFDLWLELWQFDNKRSCLTYLGAKDATETPQSAIARFPANLEACIYIQHLICKKRSIDNQSTISRLNEYSQNCDKEIADIISEILNSQAISQTVEELMLKYINQRCQLQTPSTFTHTAKRLGSVIKESWLAAPRQTRMISIMGSDGAGKTTLANHLLESVDNVSRVFTGKHLYRKSYIHKLMVILIRPLLFQSRETFDEKLAPWVYLRASLGIRIKYWRQKNKGLMLVDRTIMDFLYLDRKTDTPRFSRFRFLSNVFGKRIPIIHCIVNPQNISDRKPEMTEQGILHYNQDMFNCHSLRSPTDYLAFNNDCSLEDSVEALTTILNKL